MLFTEDYIEENRSIRDNLHPLIEEFGRKLEDHGAVVVPFRGDETDNLGDILAKWTQATATMVPFPRRLPHTISLLEEAGFELSVPRDTTKVSRPPHVAFADRR